MAIVTGGGSGIGEACSLTFARSGGKVIVADYDEEGGNRVVDAIKAEGGEAMFASVDVSKSEQVEKMVAAAVETYGGLHVAVNNAGIGGGQAPTGEYPIESWNQVIGVNLDGVFYGMRYQIPAMIESGGGSIVNMASILGSVGFATSSAYVAAKHGLVGLSKSAAIEYSAQGVRVNSVGPGFINTPCSKTTWMRRHSRRSRRCTRSGGWGRPKRWPTLLSSSGRTRLHSAPVAITSSTGHTPLSRQRRFLVFGELAGVVTACG